MVQAGKTHPKKKTRIQPFDDAIPMNSGRCLQSSGASVAVGHSVCLKQKIGVSKKANAFKSSCDNVAPNSLKGTPGEHGSEPSPLRPASRKPHKKGLEQNGAYLCMDELVKSATRSFVKLPAHARECYHPPSLPKHPRMPQGPEISRKAPREMLT